jgi:hypothetical protein
MDDRKKLLTRGKTKSDMEDLISSMQATDLGRPAEGARVETELAQQVTPSVTSGPIIKAAIFVPPSRGDEDMDGLSSTMANAKIGGKRKRKTRRRQRHRRRSHRR